MVTLFSPEYGKLSASAKGVRKQKAKLRFAAELFNYGEYILSQTNNRYVITQCTTTESFFPLRSDIDRLYSATYMLNVCETFAREGQENSVLFGLLLAALYQAAYNENISHRQLISIFTLKALQSEGMEPEVSQCIRCSSKGDTIFNFSFSEGGVYCKNCRAQGSVIPLTAAAAQLMHKLLSASLEDVWKIKPEKGESVYNEVYRLITRYIQFALDKPFKVLDYIQ